MRSVPETVPPVPVPVPMLTCACVGTYAAAEGAVESVVPWLSLPLLDPSTEVKLKL